MSNPQAQPLSPKLMHRYDLKQNIPWNMHEYHVPVLHHDQRHIIQQRLYASQKKGVKVNDFYVTKRGYYMDYSLKVAKGIPSSVEHINQQPWDSTKQDLEADALKAMRQSKKLTIYDRMEMRQTRHPIPAVSTYDLQKTLPKVNSPRVKMQHAEKRFFHQDTAFLSQEVPGSGHYNPHEEVQHLHKSRTNWQLQTKKHAALEKILLKRAQKEPAPGTYSPLHRSYDTFGTTMLLSVRDKQIKNGFGNDARFQYVRAKKRKIVQVRPAPCTYNTRIDWKDKKTSPKKKEWIKMLWKGSPPKIYH